jgi:Ca2+-binding EF-hand superfamily protein
VKGIDKDPVAAVKPLTQDDTLLARRKYLEISEEDREKMEGIMEEYRGAIQNRRINLKPMFQDFDITKNGHVTKMQFLRVLAQLGIYAPENILSLLLKRYMDKGNADEVNYVDFCNDVDRPEDMFGVGRDYNQSFQYFPRTQPRKVELDIVKHRPDDIEDVIARIRTACKQQRIRIAEFFRDFDKLRSGFITEAQFRIGLNMAKIVLSSHEFEELVQNFQAPKEGGRHVKWREFCDKVDEVFTKKGLEKAVDMVLDDARTQTLYGRTKPSKSQRNISDEVVYRFKQQLVRQRLDVKSFFQDFDRHKHFKVSPKQFRQVLASIGFTMSDEELQALVSTYGNHQNDIKYLEFINDANPN